MTESCVDFWYDWWWKQNRPSHDFGRRHWKLSNAKWLAGRCEHWVSLRRICTDELAGSSFRAVRASQARSVNQRTSNLHESLFSIPRKRVKSENPIQVNEVNVTLFSSIPLKPFSPYRPKLWRRIWSPGKRNKQTSKMFWSSKCLRKYTRTLGL